MRIYISGPMRGISELNYPEFNRVDDILVKMGYEIKNPAKAFDGKGGGAEGVSFEECMRQDIKDILECDGMVMLDGWEKSEGANIEVKVAIGLGLKFYKLKDIGPNDYLLEKYDPKDVGKKFCGDKLKWSKMLWIQLTEVMKVLQHGSIKYGWSNMDGQIGLKLEGKIMMMQFLDI